MIREVVRGLGFQAFGDAPPAPGSPRGMSYAPNQAIGRIKLVPTGNRQREATYREVYFANPFVYAATSYIARGIGRLPLHLYALDAEGEKERVRADLPGRQQPGAWLDRLLNVPGGRVSRPAFYGSTARSRLVLGNALWEIVRPGRGGMPSGLSRVPWNQVLHIDEDSWGNVRYYEVRDPGARGERRTIWAEDAIHFGLGSEMEGGCGASLLESCSSTLALHDAILRHLLAYMGNAATPSGSLYVERAGRERMKEIRDLLTELYASPENAGRILVTSGKWQSHSDSPDHAKLVELVKESRIEIAAAFQVPPPILGLLEHAIRANVKEMREQFGRDTLGPWVSEFEGELDAQLIQPNAPHIFSAFKLAEQLRPDIEARALVYQRMMHIYSIDEIRRSEDLEPLKIAGVTDIPWVASGAMPLTTAAKGKARTVEPMSTNGNADQPTLEQAAAVMLMADNLASADNGTREH